MSSVDLNIIQSYLNNPNNLTTIVFISKEKPSKKNECYDILKKANKIFDLIKEKVDINLSLELDTYKSSKQKIKD